MNVENKILEEYDIHDVVMGTVTGGCANGVFLKLENGENAYAKFGFLKSGTKVLCSILKKATEKWLTLTSIDSVVGEEGMAA